MDKAEKKLEFCDDCIRHKVKRPAFCFFGTRIDGKSYSLKLCKDHWHTWGLHDRYGNVDFSPGQIEGIVRELKIKPDPAEKTRLVARGSPRDNNRPMQQIAVFISHSGRDEPVARRLITLLRSALIGIQSDDIRCTSVSGFRLPAGASINETLKKEIHGSRAFVALITPNSIESTYVLFELGARWGTQKPMLPLLACGATSKHLEGPLNALNALSCEEPSQVHQFIDELAGILKLKTDRPAVFQRCIDELIHESQQASVR